MIARSVCIFCSTSRFQMCTLRCTLWMEEEEEVVSSGLTVRCVK